VVKPYLHARVWLVDAARLLSRTPEGLAAELIDTMLRSSAIVRRDGPLHAAAEHTSVTPGSLSVPFPAHGRWAAMLFNEAQRHFRSRRRSKAALEFPYVRLVGCGWNRFLGL
jgi:hypothetical protein